MKNTNIEPLVAGSVDSEQRSRRSRVAAVEVAGAAAGLVGAQGAVAVAVTGKARRARAGAAVTTAAAKNLAPQQQVPASTEAQPNAAPVCAAVGDVTAPKPRSVKKQDAPVPATSARDPEPEPQAASGKKRELPQPVVMTLGVLQTKLLECGNRIEYLQTNAAAVAQEIIEEYDRRSAKCLSLDVFDTLLLRNNEPEAYRFLQMSASIAKLLVKAEAPRQRAARISASVPVVGSIKLTSHVCNAFLAREIATKASYRCRPAVAGCREGHIDEILAMQARILGLDASSAASFKKIELDIETANLVINPAIVLACEAVRKRGGRVIAVSDMYLDGAAIQELIKRCGNGTSPVEMVISSADRVVSKRSGRVFDEVCKEFGLEPASILHLGDSHFSDVVKPKESGWHTMLLPIARDEIGAREAMLAKLLDGFRQVGLDVSGFAKV